MSINTIIELRKKIRYMTLASWLMIFSSTPNYAAYIDTSKADYNVSPLLMGFNIVYAYEKMHRGKSMFPAYCKN